MRIGLDAHILGKGKGGVERVVHHMVRLLPELLPQHEFVVFVGRHYVPPFETRRNVQYRRLWIANPILQRSLVLPWLAWREHIDLLHVQCAAPPLIRARLIVHMHDLLPLTAPADHSGIRDRLVRLLLPSSLRRADGVLTGSETVAAEIRSLFPFTAPKLAAIPNGIERQFFRPKSAAEPRTDIRTRFGLENDYLLYLGAFVARKNLEVAIRGFGQFLRSPARTGARPGTKLVLAGMCRSDSYLEHLRRVAEEVAPGSVVFAGFVSENECLDLLQHASIFLAPSRGEGFDLPPLEAMSCAIPVICSDLPVHRELLGDDACYFHLDQPEALAAACVLLESDSSLHARLCLRGPIRSARFTWENAMNKMAAYYVSTLALP